MSHFCFFSRVPKVTCIPAHSSVYIASFPKGSYSLSYLLLCPNNQITLVLPIVLPIGSNNAFAKKISLQRATTALNLVFFEFMKHLLLSAWLNAYFLRRAVTAGLNPSSELQLLVIRQGVTVTCNSLFFLLGRWKKPKTAA